MPSDANTRLQRVYGADFPGLIKDGTKLRSWIDAEWQRQQAAVRDRQFHFTRHDMFRRGDQWLSSRDGRTLREPKADRNTLRVTDNQIGPALNFRWGIIAEQRAGFRMEPITSGTTAREIAEAQQAFAEYYYYTQRAWTLFLDAGYWAQTHGVAFVHVYVDTSAGPKHDDVEIITQDDERYGDMLAMGYEQVGDGTLAVPLDETGNFAAPGTQPRPLYEGDLRSRVVLAAETLADPEARSLNGENDPARWFMVRRPRDVRTVRLETGNADLEAESITNTDNLGFDSFSTSNYQRGLPPYPSRRITPIKEAVMDNFIYLAPNVNALPNGAWMRIANKEVVELNEELPGGVIPFARFSDGSPDPQLYPRPEMTDWLPDQISINMLKTELARHARALGSGKLLARKGTVLEETYNNMTASILYYDGQQPSFVTPPSAGKDLYAQLQMWKKGLEDKTGWTDIARGAVTGEGGMQDVSGRALLAARETFERTLGPFVRGIAEGATEWAAVTVAIGKTIMTTPRMIPAVGRPDLALRITREKLGDDHCMIYADPETMIPMPRALRAQMLEDQLDKGRISIDQYNKRQPYADIRNLTMGDVDQWGRAQWMNTVIEERYEELAAIDPQLLYAPQTGYTVLWMDTPNVHKTALRELILDDRKPFALRKLAIDRWGIYDQLERAQMDATGMVPIPFEIIGVPPDRAQQQLQPPMQPPPQAVAGAAPIIPGQQPTGAVPNMASTVPPAAAQDTAQPLGTMGAPEQVQ